MATLCATRLRAVALPLLARPSVFKLSGVRNQSATVTVSADVFDKYNLDKDQAAIIKSLWPQHADKALAVLAQYYNATKQEKAKVEQEKAKVEQVQVSFVSALRNADFVVDQAKQDMLKATTHIYARYVQEILEHKLQVDKTKRLASWNQVLKKPENYEYVNDLPKVINWVENSLFLGIYTNCCKKSPPSGQPDNKDFNEVAQQIMNSYGLLSGGVHLVVLNKNIKGEIEIDTSNSTMCVPYQLGLKLHDLDPEIIVVKAPVTVASTSP